MAVLDHITHGTCYVYSVLNLCRWLQVGSTGTHFWGPALIFPQQTLIQSKREKNTQGGKKEEEKDGKNMTKGESRDEKNLQE